MKDLKQELEILNKIAERIEMKGGKIYFVGGCVRDIFTGKENKDIDVEVYGLKPLELKDILSEFGVVDEIGASFGIYMIHGLSIDFALPRKEIKGKLDDVKKVISIPNPCNENEKQYINEEYPAYTIVVDSNEVYGHKDFLVIPDPFMTLEEATIRRDFTMNALMQDVRSLEIVDLWNGQRDIEDGVIRHINEKTFVEDPLRVLRACQFASRFEFNIHVDTKKLCREINLSSLPKERIFMEFEKALMKSKKPSIALEWMKELGVIEKLFPELEALIDCMQDPIYHAEGSVWNHTKMVIDIASQLKEQATNPLEFMFGSLVHDLGKPATTKVINGKITSHGHEVVGVTVAESFMQRITNDKKLIESTKQFTRNHMRLLALYPNGSDKSIRKLSLDTNIQDMRLFAEADYRGRGIVERDFTPIAEWFEKRINEVGANEEIKPLVTGKDLIQLGMKPGKEFKGILDEALNYQLEGLEKEEILKRVLQVG